MTKLVAIHQPNFFPWLGYFDKMVRSDCFVFLDDVQIQKTGSAWSNRVKMLISGQSKWITAPIDRNYHGFRDIRDIQFKAESDWRDDILRAIKSSYKKAPYFNYCIELIEPLLANPDNNLATYTASAIIAIAHELSIDDTKCRWSSQLNHSGRSNELLVSLVESVGGSAYMCGGGADGYQDKDVFDAAAIKLIRQDFLPTSYPQVGSASFIPGLSIVDVLMNVGQEGARKMLSRNSQGAR